MASFKLDENLPRSAAATLEAAGHNVATVRGQGLSGATDDVVYEVCRAERRAIVTLDRGFGDPRRHPTAGTAGTIVLRPASQDGPSVLQLLERLLPLLRTDELEGALWVVEPQRVRIRKSGP